MTRRRLTPEEIELWHRVVETADRLHPRADAHPAALPRPKPKKPPMHRFEPFLAGQAAAPGPAIRQDLRPGLADRLAAAPVQMDRRAFARMKRGKLEPEARIDLHGRTLDAAHADLVRFVLSSQASGRRLVLVITGKGRSGRDDGGPIPTPRGVLRHQVPEWLAMPPLAQAVLQIEPAHLRHGGGGAYYIYLRRGR